MKEFITILTGNSLYYIDNKQFHTSLLSVIFFSPINYPCTIYVKLFVTAKWSFCQIWVESAPCSALFSGHCVFQTNGARGTVNKRLYAKDCLEVIRHKLYMDNLWEKLKADNSLIKEIWNCLLPNDKLESSAPCCTIISATRIISWVYGFDWARGWSG